MGSDNLYHRRKERKAASLRRSREKRSPYDVILIVCEGEKTEPHYFQELKDFLRLNNANIRICGKECGSDPLSVVNFAIKTLRKESFFDRAYCVFDKDRHTTYQAALDKAQRVILGKKKVIVIPSVPCFEFWLLLHYIYTTRQYGVPIGDSVCGRVMKDLKKYLPDYQKGQKDIFSTTHEFLEHAIANANRLEKFHKDSDTDNPSTEIHNLVKYLKNLKVKRT